ncbi:DUF594 family protein [Quillaja saponaria]|uniref:DUF594 family protein n=1 Tax=Quillaja saponaria TaxID=32244 RepID=A0AAD7PQ05_QUISA|nr:DUF594 family protein [Quillaja saponaria]
MQIFSATLRRLWNEWELRGMVVLSLSIQSILIMLGNRRKYLSKDWLRFILWVAYLTADWLATVSLGVLSNAAAKPEDNFVDPNYVIMAFWAPFLLLHLGGPDTITAYSMEDNELWLRHLVIFGVQVGVACQIFLRAWTNATLNFLAVPMFIAGFIKIGERIWVLWSASSQHFRESMFPDPDPGPNYARYMESYSSRRSEGFKVQLENLIESPSVGDHTFSAAENNILTTVGNEASRAVVLDNASYFFNTFKLLFADLILSFHDVVNSRSFFQNISSNQAFQVIEIELGFMYDVFYTKAILVHSFFGGVRRFISFLCIFGVACTFIFIGKNQYSIVDVLITYILLTGAIILEIYSVHVLLCSDWTLLWLSNHRNKVLDLLSQAISSFPGSRNKRWSETMAQFNLITFCTKDRPSRCSVIKKILCTRFCVQIGEAIKNRAAKWNAFRMIARIYESIQKYQHKDAEAVPDVLKEMIFEQFQKKIKDAEKDAKKEEIKKDLKLEVRVAEKIKEICANRGGKVLERENCSQELGWSIEVEFDQSILLWHIATDLCFYSDSKDDIKLSDNQNCKAARLLSNYMVYLLVFCPFMLPNGIGQIRFQDTCAEANEYFIERKCMSDKKRACKMLLKVSTAVPPSKVKGDRSKSVLFNALDLANLLNKLQKEKKWELLAHVWMEMLSYAASHCQWNHHAQQLRRGGELLTHVWFLMAHLGITEQFQISEGHGRAKLIAK